MIVISAALVAAAIVLLLVGVFAVHMLLLVYASIGVSVVAALLLGAGAFIKRDELFGDEAAQSSEAPRRGSPEEAAAKNAGGRATASKQGSSAVAPPGSPEQSAGTSTAVADPPASTVDVPDDARVYVVAGRKAYHLPSCRQLRKRERRELAYREALDEGYTACAACLPDTALAARSSSGPSPAGSAPAGYAAASGDVASADDAAAAGDPGVADSRGATEATAADGGGPSAPVGADDVGDAGGVGVQGTDETDETTQAALVGVVEGWQRYHRLTCAVVEDAIQDNVNLATMRRDEADLEGKTPCTVCLP